jgi:hypothetical protein
MGIDERAFPEMAIAFPLIRVASRSESASVSAIRLWGDVSSPEGGASSAG